HDLFDVLEPDAHLLEEISCISRDRDRLIGRATDPISIGQALGEIAERGYFRETGAHVLCFGAGGAGHAISLHLLRDRDPEDRPPRLVVTDSNPDRLTHLQRI